MSRSKTVAIWRSCLLSGSETFIRNQGSALTRWQPTFVGAVKIESPIAADTDLIAYPRPGRDWFLLRLTGRSPRLTRLLAAERPALVHAHFAGDGWLVSRAAQRLGVPLVITVHGLDVTWQPNRPGVRGARHRRHLRTAFSRASLVVAVSEYLRDRAIELGADPAKVRVHHTGVPIPAERLLPKKWDVTFVGRFVEKKGVDDLIEALGMLERPGLRALFVGTGPLREAMRDRAEALGLDATFVGAADPPVVNRYLAESHLFVAPSKTASNGDAEGLPTTILEAASMGLPVVSTYHSGIPEAVVPGETGLLCAEGDRPALAESIEQLLADDGMRVRLGQQARHHVTEHFDLAKQTLLLEDMYDEVVSREPVGQRAGG